MGRNTLSKQSYLTGPDIVRACYIYFKHVKDYLTANISPVVIKCFI